MALRPVIGITMDIDKRGWYVQRPEYSKAVEEAGGVGLLIPPVGEPTLYTGLIDGLLIPGGKDIEPYFYGEKKRTHTLRPVKRQRTDFEILLFHEIIKRRKSILGICYGAQLMNVALGGSLYQDIYSELKTPIDHKAPHEIDIYGGPLRKGTKMVNSSHHQAIKRLGAGLEPCAESKDRLVEAIWLRDYPFALGLQWHPERLEDNLSKEIFSLFIEAAREHK